MFFYIVLTPISTTSGLQSTGNTRRYHQIDVYIYQCVKAHTKRFMMMTLKCSINVRTGARMNLSSNHICTCFIDIDPIKDAKNLGIYSITYSVTAIDTYVVVS